MKEKKIKAFSFYIRANSKNKLSSRNEKKYSFLDTYIIGRKILTTHNTFLNTVNIGNDLEVSPKTVMNWIKELIKFDILECTCSKWRSGEFSKRYRLTEKGKELVNEFNGYNKKYPVFTMKKKIRKERFKKLNKVRMEMDEATYIASSYLGCIGTLLHDLKHNVHHALLFSPRQNNLLQPKIMNFFYAYKRCIHGTNYKKITKKEFIEMVEDVFEVGFADYIHGHYVFDDQVLNEYLYAAQKDDGFTKEEISEIKLFNFGWRNNFEIDSDRFMYLNGLHLKRAMFKNGFLHSIPIEARRELFAA